MYKIGVYGRIYVGTKQDKNIYVKYMYFLDADLNVELDDKLYNKLIQNLPNKTHRFPDNKLPFYRYDNNLQLFYGQPDVYMLLLEIVWPL